MDDTTETTSSSSSGGKKWAIGGVLGIGLMVAAPMWFFFIGPQLRHDRLVEKGKQAEGRLLAVDETGTYINDSPELELVVEFTHDGKLDTATTDVVPNRRYLHMYLPDARVKVAYDPEDPHELTVTEISTNPGPAFSSSPTTVPGINVDSIKRAVADSVMRAMQSGK